MRLQGLNTIKPSTHTKPELSIVCFFSREYPIKKWLDCFSKLEVDRETTEVIFIVDYDVDEVYDPLFSWLMANQDWNSVKLYNTGHKQVLGMIADRRDRIVELQELSKTLIGDSKYVFGLEDDTLFEPNTLHTLLEDIKLLGDDCGFVQGVQVGRHRLKVVGAWLVDDLQDPKEIRTIDWIDNEEIQAIDGGGYYCFITPTLLYKNITRYWKHECFGPDMTYGLELRKLGYTCYIDKLLKTGHFTEQGILRADEYTVSAVWSKQEDGSYSFKQN